MFTNAVAMETMMNRIRRSMRVTAANTPGVEAGHGFDKSLAAASLIVHLCWSTKSSIQRSRQIRRIESQGRPC